jgi:nuclease S1
VKNRRLACSILLLVAAVGLVPSAWGWGCKGHQVVALIAEKNLNPHARAMAMQILAASPISPDLRRYCGNSGLDPFADSSTWADDERSVQHDTGGWHDIDIPLGVSHGDLGKYCPPSTGCVTSAINAQLAVLRNPDATPQEKADALRYVIHFVGDLHQPLHTTTNNDLGGNCVPVTFEGYAPEETNAEWGAYRPNLHAVWDTGIIEQFSRGETPQQLADELENEFKPKIPVWESEPVDLTAWVWQSHRIAQDTAYGLLPVQVPIETPQDVHSCAGDDHISARMFKLHEQLGNAYVTAAEAAIQKQLARAGARLADVLNSLWH